MSQVSIALLNGYETVLAFSLNSADITLTFSDGTVITETPAGYGTGNIAYKATFDLSGVWSDFGRKPYVATQGANSRSGTYTTTPAAGDDFIKFFQTCDGPLPYTSIGTSGYWEYMQAYADSAIPVAGILFCDDFMYASAQTFSSDEATVSSQPAVTADADDYLKVYTMGLGLFSNATGNVAVQGYNAERQYCLANFNLWPQWGDWEFANDIGISIATQDNITGSPTSLAKFTAGKAAYDIILAPLQPPAIDGLNSNAWGFTCGDAYICAPDYITNADWSSATPVVYGGTQIGSVLTALNNSAPFKILGIGHGIRYLDPAAAEGYKGAQHPLFDGALGEYKSIFTETGNDPPSLMDNPKCNGLQGITVIECGDYHRMKAEHHQKGAYTGNAPEDFWAFTQGGNNGGAAPFPVSAQILSDYNSGTLMPTSGADQNLTELVYLGSPDTAASPGRQSAGQVMTIYGSRHPKELHVEQYAAPTSTEIGTNDNQLVLGRKFIFRFGGNTAYAQTQEVTVQQLISASSD